MTDAYDWTQFTVHMHYRAPLDRVLAAWTTAEGLSSFFIGSARHESEDGVERAQGEPSVAGDRYAWDFLHGFHLDGRLLPCEGDERVAFTFGGGLRVGVSFRERDDAVEVRLHQTGCATEDPARAWQHVNCRSCWIYFMLNLKSVLENGADLRDHQHPVRNDSVSIGYGARA